MNINNNIYLYNMIKERNINNNIDLMYIIIKN